MINELFDSFLPIYLTSSLEVEISSVNTFPTGAGCASSASGGACLVTALKGLLIDYYQRNSISLELPNKLIELELSALARKLSGSASRSVYEGFVEWSTNGISESRFSTQHWPEFRILLLIVSDKTKDYSSTDGMKISKETSEFLAYRVKSQVEPRIIQMKGAIEKKDLSTVCELTMRDSNSFHAVCRDSFPPLLYMNETSDFIVKCANVINNLYSESPEIVCGYTFDAGPNAFVVSTEKYIEFVSQFIEMVLLENELKETGVVESIKKLAENHERKVDLCLVAKLASEKTTKNYRIEKSICFMPGSGAELVKVD